MYQIVPWYAILCKFSLPTRLKTLLFISAKLLDMRSVRSMLFCELIAADIVIAWDIIISECISAHQHVKVSKPKHCKQIESGWTHHWKADGNDHVHPDTAFITQHQSYMHISITPQTTTNTNQGYRKQKLQYSGPDKIAAKPWSACLRGILQRWQLNWGAPVIHLLQMTGTACQRSANKKP